MVLEHRKMMIVLEHGEIWVTPKREPVVPERHELEAGQSFDTPC